MAFTPRDWTNGEDVYDVDMDRIEQGIVEALASPAPPMLVGEWRAPLGVGSTNNLAMSNDRVYGSPIWLEAASYDQMNCYVGAGGTTGSVVRLGIIAVDGTLLVDAGTVTSIAAGTKIVTFASALVLPKSQWVYGVVVSQGSPATPPNITRVQAAGAGGLIGVIGHPTNSLTGLPQAGWVFLDPVTDVLPATIAQAGRVGTNAAVITVRRSA